ncbi:MAG: hypothetical protein AAGC73_06595 [Verrucomicrobiota bacterium]
MPWSVNGEQISLPVLTQLALAEKVVIDMTNPLNADWSPLSLGADNSAGEETAKALPESYVVKAFNTIFADMMAPEKLASLAVKPAGFYCGNDVAAKAKVSQLLATAGFDPIDAGSIGGARYLEQMAHLNIRLALSVENGTQAAFSYHRI